jgi:hypothetical protein
MAQMTIAQMGERELDRLVSYRTETPTAEDYAKAKKLMNSFYRLCGLSETNLYLCNTERTCNLKSTGESVKREEKWYDRLRKEFQDFCGLTLFYTGYAPSIGTKDSKTGAVCEKVSRFFYN